MGWPRKRAGMQIATKSVGGYAEFRAGQWDPRLFYPGSGKERGEARFCFVPGSSHGSQSTALSHTHGSAALQN